MQAPECVCAVVATEGISWDFSFPTRAGTCVSCIEDGLLTTGPPGKSLVQFFNWNLFSVPLPHASDFLWQTSLYCPLFLHLSPLILLPSTKCGSLSLVFEILSAACSQMDPLVNPSLVSQLGRVSPWVPLLLNFYLSVSCSVVSGSLWPPWTVACQPPLSIGFPKQEYWDR